MYEHRSHRLLNRRQFARRVGRHFLFSTTVISAGLGVGILGYHFLVGLSWLDALLNACMILGGMGPVDPIDGAAGKWFASFYALFAGLVILGASSLLVAPFFHRLIHRFHLEEEQD